MSIVLYPAIHTPCEWLGTRPCVTQKREVVILTEVLHIIIQFMIYNQHGGTTLHSHQRDTVQNLAWHNFLTLSAWISLSCSFRKAFTFEKHSSMGFRSGEYGGIKCTRALVLWISEITLSVRWIEALSMGRTLCGLTQLKGSKCGIEHFFLGNPRILLHQQILWLHTHPTFHLVPLSLLLKHAFLGKVTACLWHVYLWNIWLQGYWTMREIMC